MLATSKLMAFVATVDAERAKVSYPDVLGLRLVADEPFALVFDANGTAVRIQKAPHHRPLPHTALGWEVRGIAEIVAQLSRHGVSCERFAGFDQDAAGIWTTPGGGKVAWFKDPDGNLLSVTES
jgi:catechol 2,3-dioxygenase-like lactoylglutathione lyase family enzyme